MLAGRRRAGGGLAGSGPTGLEEVPPVPLRVTVAGVTSRGSARFAGLSPTAAPGSPERARWCALRQHTSSGRKLCKAAVTRQGPGGPQMIYCTCAWV